MPDQVTEVVCGNQAPDEIIITTGSFPSGWELTYLESLADASVKYTDPQNLGSGIVDAVHWASFHLWFRYLTWLYDGQPNPNTEAAFGRIQLESELFFWNSLPLWPPLEGTSLPGDKSIRRHEREVIRLCLYDNKPLLLPGVDQIEIDKWTAEYRLHVSAIRQSWASDRLWNRWAVQAIRFASIYLGIAPLSEQGKAEADKERGLFPDRIGVAVARIQPLIPTPTVELLSRWLRLAHLPRSSEGTPSFLSSFLLPGKVRVRSSSEFVLQSGRIATG